MSVLVAVNEATDPLGALEAPLRAAGLELSYWHAQADPLPSDVAAAATAVIALGGASHPDEEAFKPWLADERALLVDAVARGIPVLGVCLGAQLLAEAVGGRVHRLPRPVIGWTPMRPAAAAAHDPLGAGAWASLHEVLEWHTCGFALPDGGVLLAGAPERVEAFRYGPCAWGFQYHLEADHRLAAAWAAAYGEEVAAAGVVPGALAAAPAPRHGVAVATRFAELVRERATAVPA